MGRQTREIQTKLRGSTILLFEMVAGDRHRGHNVDATAATEDVGSRVMTVIKKGALKMI